jgi:hypothetical protein
MMQKTASDPFRLRALLSAPTPQQRQRSRTESGLSSPLRGVAADVRDDISAREDAELAVPRIPRHLLREICRPFFEQMVEAVEEAILTRFHEEGGISASDEGMAEDDVAPNPASSDLDEYPFLDEQQDIIKETSLSEIGTLNEQAALDAADDQPSRERSVSFEIPSNPSSSSIGSSVSWSAPSSASWRGEAMATCIHPAASPGSAQPELHGLCSDIVASAAPARALAAPLVSPLPMESKRGSSRKSTCSGDSSMSTKKLSIHTCTGSKGMVCRHWENKGWCKYQDQCKFAHPEHRRGACAGSSNSVGNKAQVPYAAGPMLSATPGYGISCMTFVPPAMQQLGSQPGCVYPFVLGSSQA